MASPNRREKRSIVTTSRAERIALFADGKAYAASMKIRRKIAACKVRFSRWFLRILRRIRRFLSSLWPWKKPPALKSGGHQRRGGR